MADLTMREMLEAGMHFGHQTNRWNPKMRPYIFGARNGIYIIDLQKTVPLFHRAYQFLVDTVRKGQNVLFVGTKKQAQDIIQEEATRAGQFYVNSRWLGGTLTNYRTLKASLDRLINIEKMATDGTFDKLTKKEVLLITREQDKLKKNIGGMKTMTRLPGAIVVIDTQKDSLAVAEANKSGISVVASLDTNCNPDVVDYPIPANDDAKRAICLLVVKLAEACLEGNALYQKDLQLKAATDKERAPKDSGNREQRQQPPPNQPGRPQVEVVRPLADATNLKS